MNTIEEAKIIHGLRQRDGKCLEKLFYGHKEYIYNVARRRTYLTDEAEDVTQLTFIKVWRDIDEFKGDYDIRGWLRGIAIVECKNMCFERHGYGREFRTFCDVDVLNGFHDLKDFYESTENIIINREDEDVSSKRVEVVLRYIGQLSVMQQLIFQLVWVECADWDVIQKTTNMNKSQISALQSQAWLNIREMIKKDEPSLISDKGMTTREIAKIIGKKHEAVLNYCYNHFKITELSSKEFFSKNGHYYTEYRLTAKQVLDLMKHYCKNSNILEL
jgi:RNA polymerase sigma-70 factor (ECF subfamily)